MILLTRRFLCLPFLALFLNPSTILAQTEPDYRLPEILVTAGRIPSDYSHLSRSLTIIAHDDIQYAPDPSFAGLLSQVAGVDVRRRGPGGVQADVAVRDGTFEQTLVLLNGVPLSDSQTGHHNLNIPITYDEIERIEVLKGPGSRAFGANAFNGVINIITRQVEEGGLRLSASGGQNGLYDGLISASMPLGITRQRFAYQRAASDGYRRNTDYSTNTVSYDLQIPASSGALDLQAGYTDKEFGANGFYSDRFPMQWEHTKTGFIAASGKLITGSLTSRLALSLRNGNDEFLLIRDNPAFYRNVHSVKHYSATYSGMWNWAGGTSVAGVEAQHDNINSTKLGVHQRTSGGVFAEHQVEPVTSFLLSFGGYAHKYDRFGWQFSPGADVSYALGDGIRLFGSVNRSFRIATFTELYYQDPANLGNADLKPEKSLAIELGSAYDSKSMRISASAFYRNSEDLIDWTRKNASDPWQVMNITQTRTRGFELSVETAAIPLFMTNWLRRIRVGYSYLDSDVDPKGAISKYVLEHLRHQAVTDIVHEAALGIVTSWRMRLLRRVSQPETYVVADLRLSKEIDRFDMYISATNLFNTAYTEIGFIPMPGRWIQGGVSYRVAFN